MLAILTFLATLGTIAATPTTAECPCSANVNALASGIHLNIQGQYAEYNGTVKLLNLAQSSEFSQKDYFEAKGELVSEIQAGQNIRLFNQQIAPKDNAAIPGLAKYEAAQQPEAAIAKGLTGDPSKDLPNLQTLKNDIIGGIKLNKMNLKNATQDCDFELVFPDPQYAAGP